MPEADSRSAALRKEVAIASLSLCCQLSTLLHEERDKVALFGKVFAKKSHGHHQRRSFYKLARQTGEQLARTLSIFGSLVHPRHGANGSSRLSIVRWYHVAT